VTYFEAHDLIDHPARGAWLRHARDDNPDVEQRDAARATLVRLATGGTLTTASAPTPEDLELRALVARRPCCPGG
jgi:hypothetical protein